MTRKISGLLFIILFSLPLTIAYHIDQQFFNDINTNDLQKMSSDDISHNIQNIEKSVKIKKNKGLGLLSQTMGYWAPSVI